LLTHRGAGTQLVSGTIETDEVRVASRYGGRVTAIHTQEGDIVAPGQLLVELDAAELTARRDQAAARLAELERGPRVEDIAAAQAEWEALQAQVEFARLENQRAQELFVAQTISSAERDQAASRANALEKSAAAAAQRYALLKAGTRAEQIAQARAQLAEIEAQLAEMKIYVPGGPRSVVSAADSSTPAVATERDPPYVLETLSVKVGDVVPPDKPVATLLLADRLWVQVYVPELWLDRIQLGQTVRVGEDVTGVVEQIARQAEFTPRNVQTVGDRIRQMFGVKIRLPADKLRAGMSVDVTFPNVPPPPK
jgi:HlyD family secretion protein